MEYVDGCGQLLVVVVCNDERAEEERGWSMWCEKLCGVRTVGRPEFGERVADQRKRLLVALNKGYKFLYSKTNFIKRKCVPL